MALGWRSGIGRPPTREIWVGVANGVLRSPVNPQCEDLYSENFSVCLQVRRTA
jgi:hypothetical protein